MHIEFPFFAGEILFSWRRHWGTRGQSCFDTIEEAPFAILNPCLHFLSQSPLSLFLSIVLASRLSMAQIVAAPFNGSSSLLSPSSGSGAIKKSLKPSAIPSKFYGQEKETKRRSRGCRGCSQSLVSVVVSRSSTVLPVSPDDVVKVSLICC